MTAARKALGAFGEDKAAAWYERNGYRVVARNWRCRDGELDIVARRGSTVVFCEVKTPRLGRLRRARRGGHARRSSASCARLAVLWLRATGARAGELRFDVASVLGGKLEIIEAAF